MNVIQNPKRGDYADEFYAINNNSYNCCMHINMNEKQVFIGELQENSTLKLAIFIKLFIFFSKNQFKL